MTYWYEQVKCITRKKTNLDTFCDIFPVVEFNLRVDIRMAITEHPFNPTGFTETIINSISEDISQ